MRAKKSAAGETAQRRTIHIPSAKEIQRLYNSTSTQATKRYKCPVHHGKNLSVAVGYIDGRAWAKCWSQGCASADILAALGITSSSSIPWTPAPARPRPTGVDYLPPVSPFAASEYLKGILTPSGSAIAYQRDDGLSGRHWRSDTKRRNPGVTGDGWQLRRFDPVDPSSSTAICLAEGEKDAAKIAAAGLIAFTAPRGAQSLPLADFTELVILAKDTHLPVLLCGDRDEVGREAMRKVRRLLKIDLHLDAIDITSLAPEKGGSVADLPAEDFLSLIRVKLSDRDPRWQKPIRSRAQYLEYKCPRPKRNIKGAGDLSGIRDFRPCGNTATCPTCAAWETFLHVERCWQGKPAQMLRVSGFGDDGSTIAETTGLGKLYRERLEWRLRKSSRVHQKEKNPSSKQENFMTALALGDDYRAALTMFFSSPLSAKQIARERRRAADAGLGFQVTDVVMREDIEAAAPPALTIKMEGLSDSMSSRITTSVTNTWTSSGWPTWWEPETTYAFSDGRDLEKGEDFPNDSISAKEWKTQHHQAWDTRKSLIENLWQREEYALINSQLWMAPCHGLSLEMLQAIAEGENAEALIEEVGDYEGPTALLVDAAAWLTGRKEWRKAFRPVLDAAGWRGK